MYLNYIPALKAILSEKGKKAVILSHKNPDGDAIGASLGWKSYLSLKGWDVETIMPNNFPKFLSWIPGCDAIQFADEMGETSFVEKLQEADLIFCLDFNSLNRILFGEQLKFFKDKVVMIDHHQLPEDFAALPFSKPEACATAELIIELIQELENGELLLDKDGATALYVGLLTDSGSFRFPSTSAETFRSAAALIDKGADNAEIYRNIYDTSSQERLQLLAHTLHNCTTFYKDKGAALMMLSKKDMYKFNFQKGDAEGFVNYPLSVENIRLSALFKEDEGIVKISLRSKGDLAVNEISMKHFQGGGHTNAAGGKVDGGLKEAKELFEKVLNEL